MAKQQFGGLEILEKFEDGIFSNSIMAVNIRMKILGALWG
jgi:hypothetical protein